MIRRIAAVVLTAFPLALHVPAVPASAGGGCHAGVTTGDDPTVVMADACFTATITNVDPGQAVTFVNEDPMTHNVTANLWGNFEDMNQGDTYTVTFDDEGIYPFACSYHPGMTGAIVVGDGNGAGNGAVVAPTSSDGSTGSGSAALEDAGPAGSTSEGTSNAWPWLAGIAIGAVVGFGLASIAGRRRSVTTPVPSATST